MIHTVYKTTNTINGKYYIGIHSTIDPNDDYLGSGRYLLRAIKKHGREVFKKEIIAICETREQAFFLEKLIVTEEFSRANTNYNTRAGGGGYPEPQPIKPKEPKINLNKLKGYERTERQKNGAKIHSERMKGRKAHNAKQIVFLGETHKSVTSAMKSFGISYNTYCLIKNSEKQYQNLEEAKKDIWLNRGRKISESKSGKNYNRNGYRHSPETREKIRIGNLRRWNSNECSKPKEC